ncbi:hypothetical protein AB0L13_44960 [Saccharopolyspora shandongensis]|uniref:hypothetical protein n=1 Tax=Saccharopolyspora shandongensis TaxID=418495 RepID=UPI00343F2EB1
MAEDLAVDAAGDSFAVSVRLGCLGRRLRDLHVLGFEDRVEGVGVLRVAVTEQEAQRLDAHPQVGGHVASVLGHPV